MYLQYERTQIFFIQMAALHEASEGSGTPGDEEKQRKSRQKKYPRCLTDFKFYNIIHQNIPIIDIIQSEQ